MKKSFTLLARWLALLAVIGWLAACAGLSGPRVITLSEADLARQIANQFPLERNLLGALNIRVDAPRVKLLPESNRIGTELDFTGGLSRAARTARGMISLDYGLRYDEASQMIRLTQVHVRSLQFDTLRDQPKAAVDKFGSLLAEQLLQDLPIYRLKPEDLKNAEGKGFRPGAVTVKPRGVEITLVPVGR
jgi:hypothetical protein